LHELLESSDEEQDIVARRYREMTNRNVVRNYLANKGLTDKECDNKIKIAFGQKMSRSLCDSDYDNENVMPKQSLEKKEQLQAITNNQTRNTSS
jgi:hypothetical protein